MRETLNNLLEGYEYDAKSVTIVFKETSESRAEDIQAKFRREQSTGGYTLGKDSIDYKCKKDKEGNILDELWIVTEKIDFEV